jgi:glycosyltransferase involved in cell wall biosynthesis
MVSFQGKLLQGLKRRGVQVTHDLDDAQIQAVLVVGGTRHLAGLRRARRRGLRVVQRLDGMNWLHRQAGLQQSGVRHFLRAEYGNLLLALLRRRVATHIVYQSHFVQQWWEGGRKPAAAPSVVIYNGVDLAQYSPHGSQKPPENFTRLLLVEGSLMGGYEQGLESAVGLAQRLAQNGEVELMVVGRVAESLQQAWQARLAGSDSGRLRINWYGLAAQEDIPRLDRAAHLLYSSDINAACPNSVIEALACGLPVAAFDTGALPELVNGDSGRVVPYGGDPWKLEPPDLDALAQAAGEIIARQAHFRAAARQRAEDVFGLEPMVDAYLQVLLGGAA